MMRTMLWIVSLVGVVSAQSAIDLLASAALGGSSATGAASGTGEAVTGSIDASIDETSSSTTAVITASGPATTPNPSPSATPSPTPAPTPTPTPAPPTKKHYTVPEAPKKSPMPVVYMKKEKVIEPTCEDVVNATCTDIKKYEHCGFCLLDKYPTHGTGCSYTKQMVKEEGKKGEYEVVLVPECECQGVFILEAEKCPTCDSALKELLVCAKAEASEVVEIPAECIEKVGVSIDYLVECGYVKATKEKKEDHAPVVKKYIAGEEEKEKEDPTMIVIKKEKAVKPSPAPMPVPLSMVPTASASSQAVASGPGASASASASASISN